VRITVLGKSPSWQDAGGACSGYLVEDGETCLLVDCGSGVLAKLRQVRDYVDVDAVVISHMHADHFLDLIPYANALTFTSCQQPIAVECRSDGESSGRPHLLLPPGGSDVVRTITAAGGQAELVGNAFNTREYDPAESEQVGSLRLRFQPVPHYTPTNAIEVTSSTGAGRFTYGADHRPTDVLCGFAHATDLLMLEATLSRPERDGSRGHLTPSEAGEHAASCRAARLVLTHISDELDWEWAKAEAQRTYCGPVEIALPGNTYTV
jgi:ribonuclease BN (tRNA processing enzyme)